MSRSCLIDSQSVLISPNWTVNDRINARTTLNIRVVDLKSLPNIDIGDPITLSDGATTIFSGIVQTIKTYEAMPNKLFYDLKCIDNSALADKILIAETGTNETAGYIIQNVILPKLSAEGVTAGSIETGATISKYTFNYIKCSTALDQIKNITGMNWNIDASKQLNFFANDTNTASWNLTDSTQHSKFSLNSSLKDYRNVQYIRAGKGRTATQTDEKPSPKPDGVARTFVCKYPLAEKPTIKINTVAISASDVGVSGLDTSKKWYFTYNSNTVIQDDSETVLSDTDTIEITYTGLYDILVETEDEAEILTRSTVESGTSGRYEHITEEKSITEADEALEFGEGLLNKYGEIFDIVTFETTENGLSAGELLSVNKTLYGINSSFLIESITVKPFNTNTLTYNVKCLDGASLGGWEEYFKDILKNQKTYVINENESLIKLRRIRESFTVTENFASNDENSISSESMTLGETMTATGATPENRVGFALVGFSEAG